MQTSNITAAEIIAADEQIIHYEVFVDEGPVSGRLKKTFADAEAACRAAENATDGKWWVYAIHNSGRQSTICKGRGAL